MRHHSGPFPRTIGIISREDILNLSAIHGWASLFPDIEQVLVFCPNVQNNRSFSEKPVFKYVAAMDGKEELCQVFRDVLVDTAGPVTEDDITSHLWHKIEPDYLIIVGSTRLPNVLIWQSVYAELYFAEKLNRKRDFVRAVCDYRRRNRRFGK